MLERFRDLRWASALLCCLLSMCAWFGCLSTETGNPPVALDPSSISWLRHGDDAEVIGQEGAVQPGGSVVEVLVNGEVVGSVTSKSNGSFKVTAAGAGDGNFEIRAVKGRHSDTLKSSDIKQQDATSVSVDPLTEADAASEVDATPDDAGAPQVPPGSAAPDAAAPATPDAALPDLDAATANLGAATAPTLDATAEAAVDARSLVTFTDAASTTSDAVVATDSAACMDLQDQIEERLSQAYSEAIVGCGTAQDCVVVSLSGSCYQACDSPVLRSKTTSITAAVMQIDQELCAPYNAMACAPIGEPCEPLNLPVLCSQGMCMFDNGTPQVTDGGRTVTIGG